MDTNAYAIGITVRVSATFDNGVGALTDPTTVTLRVKGPDETVTEYTWAEDEVIRDSKGCFHKDIEVVVGGWWYYRWEGGGIVEAVSEGKFYGMLSDVIGDGTEG
jgi:hypothetical protein